MADIFEAEDGVKDADIGHEKNEIARRRIAAERRANLDALEEAQILTYVKFFSESFEQTYANSKQEALEWTLKGVQAPAQKPTAKE